MSLEMSLREHLLAQAGAGGPNAPPYPPMSAPQSGTDNLYQGSDSGSPHDHLDSNAAGGQLTYGMSGDSAGDEAMSPDARKGKRELSTSKRAAQNRAAQRAFRQRKEGYIKKLEEQVKEFQAMDQNFRALQNENYQLREYILNLQSRLLENQADFPPAPSHINISSAATASTSRGATGPSGEAEQRQRRELQHQHDGLPPPVIPAEPMRQSADLRSEAPPRRAPEVAGRPQHDSPYGLGSDYSAERPRGGQQSVRTGEVEPS